MIPLLAILLAAAPLHARDFRFGVKAGVPLTRYFETGRFGGGLVGMLEYSAATRRYIVGLTADYRLNSWASLELDSLYQRMGYVRIESASPYYITRAYDIKGHSFDFPIMPVFRVAPRLPLAIGAGGVVRYVRPSEVRGVQIFSGPTGPDGPPARQPLTETPIPELDRHVYGGITAAILYGVPARRVTFRPEFRYTRWLSNIESTLNLLRFPANQAEFLLGVVF